MKNKITVLGDVHGKYKRLHEILREKEKYEYVVQIGDLGFDYSTLDNVDHEKFKIVSGNHDNMDKIVHIPHYLGDYGYTSLNNVNFFYYRGAYSIDISYRTIGINWWDNEQINIKEFMNAKELYRTTRPDTVLTHDCPNDIAWQMISPGGRIHENNTTWLLQELYDIHQPKLWIFGHWHCSRTIQHGNTKFICLDELEIYELFEPKG